MYGECEDSKYGTGLHLNTLKNCSTPSFLESKLSLEAGWCHSKKKKKKEINFNFY